MSICEQRWGQKDAFLQRSLIVILYFQTLFILPFDFKLKLLTGLKVMKAIYCLILLSLANTALADYSEIITNTDAELVIEIEQSYILGDSDTKIDARNIALQQAKQKAAEMAGSYVESERIIENDTIKYENIRTISTALMQTKVKDEVLSVNDLGQVQITLTAITSLDKSSILAKLGLLEDDNQKQQQVNYLQQENDRLQQELGELNKKLATFQQSQQSGTIQAKPRQELAQRRDEIFTAIEQNKNSISAIFERGTLLAMAKQGSQDFEAAKIDISTNVWNYVVNNTDVSLGEPKFLDNGDGTYNIEIKVDWLIKPGPILRVLNKYFWSYNGRPIVYAPTTEPFTHRTHDVIEINRFTNEEESKKVPYADRLFEYYSSKSILLRLTAGNKSSSIRIVDLYSGRSRRRSGYLYLIQTTPGRVSLFDSNPVVIEGVTANDLERLTSIDAEIIIQ